jgi:hypothetical protein
MSQPITVDEREQHLREEFLKAKEALDSCYEVAYDYLKTQEETDGSYVSVCTVGQGYKITIKVEKA